MECESFDDAGDGPAGWRVDWAAIFEEAMAGLFICGGHGSRRGFCNCDLFQFLGENVWARAIGANSGNSANDDRPIVRSRPAITGEMLCLVRFLLGSVLHSCRRR